MKTSIATAAQLFSGNRLDARYVVDGIADLRRALSSSSHPRLISDMGIATMPSRIKKVSATPNERSVPYLRPYDVFEFLPPQSDAISWDRTPSVETYTIQAGDILQTRSGRNLGPVALADAYLARFALSDDMVRIRIDDPSERLYTFAFLRSRIGQRTIRGNRGGSVISHISYQQVGAIEVPFVTGLVDKVVTLAAKGAACRESARLALDTALNRVNQLHPEARFTMKQGWTIQTSQLGDRLDAAFHAAPIKMNREMLAASGGIPLGDVAEVVKPSGRTKMVYVDADHGEPFLSGRQILQCDIVAAKYLARSSKQNAGGFALSEDSVIFQSDGRAQEGLGYPAYVTKDRQGWLASGHVGRAIPFDSDDAGWIWASMASDIVRSQVVSLSCGSVVDALYPEDVGDVLLPPRDAVDSDAVRAAWREMAEGSLLLQQASDLIDEALGTKEGA